jgi:hypothetical protein
MRILLGSLYSVLFLCYLFAGAFVLFHLLRYSLNKRHGIIGSIVFAFVAFLLLFSNALLFLNLPFEELLIINTL